ncbi:MAG TPA: hypothetical protein VE988_15150 [Gemmataceae bacterium]|nr:hypothetical protein [Gemmataceae bacterium]
MSKEYARVEAVVNWVVGKPVAALVFGVFIGSRWTVKRIASVLKRLRCMACSNPVVVTRR